jgi:alkylation response protein AidB-like acyl-CoA dehydrogenase
VSQETELARFADEIRPFIRSHRAATEAERRIAGPIVDRLIQSGVCRMALLRDAGGLETDPVVACRVYEHLAWAEPSVAWIVWNNQLPCLLARFLDADVRRDLFRDARALLGNSTRASGRAVVENGGYRLSGRWSLVSGCEFASWLPLLAVVADGDTPRMLGPDMPDARMFVVPKDSFSIVDTWHSSGLRGTGSHDVIVEDVFVAEPHCFSWLAESKVDTPFARLPIFALMGAGCASICLGAAQAALDGLRDVIAHKVQTDPRPALKARPEVLALVARCEYWLATSRGELHAALAAVRDACGAGHADAAARARLWRAALMGAEQAKAMIGQIADAAGTPALYADSPIERAHRDVHAILQHIVLAPMWLVDAGKPALGIPVENPMF